MTGTLRRGDSALSVGAEPLPEPLATVAATVGAPGLSLALHGPHHWRCVALTGIELARRDPRIDLAVVYRFAQLHDSQRYHDGHDDAHGPRAAALVLVRHPSDRALYLAMRDHTRGRTSRDPTIGACWDADRFNLCRVGVDPSIEFMSTTVARRYFTQLAAFARSAVASQSTWNLVDRAVRSAW